MANRDSKKIERTLKDFSLGINTSGGGGAIFVDELPETGEENTVYVLNNSTHEGGINWFCMGGPGRDLTDMWYGRSIIILQTYDDYTEQSEALQNEYVLILETGDVYYDNTKLTKLCYGHYIDENNYAEINLVKGFGETTLDYIYLDGTTGHPSEEMNVYCWYVFQSDTKNLTMYGGRICDFAWRLSCLSFGNGLYSKKIDSTKCTVESVNKKFHDSTYGNYIFGFNFYTSPELPRTFGDLEYVTLGNSRFPKYTYIDEEGNVYLACWTSLYYLNADPIECSSDLHRSMQNGQWYYVITNYFAMGNTEYTHKFADWGLYTAGNGISSSVLPMIDDDTVIHWVRYSFEEYNTALPDDELMFVYKPFVAYQDKYVWEKGQWFDYTEAMFK